MSELYTVEDYYSLDPDSKDMWELIKGVFKMSPAPLDHHQHIVGELHLNFGSYFSNKECIVRISPYDVILGDNVVQPDICVICDKSKIKRRGCVGPPDLIVEVISPSRSSRDLKDKLSLYEEFGVLEYWIVFPNEREIWQYIFKNGKYTSKTVHTGPVSSYLFPQLSVDISEKGYDVLTYDE